MAQTVKQKLQAEIADLNRELDLVRGKKVGCYLHISEVGGKIAFASNLKAHETLGMLQLVELQTRYEILNTWNTAARRGEGD